EGKPAVDTRATVGCICGILTERPCVAGASHCLITLLESGRMGSLGSLTGRSRRADISKVRLARKVRTGQDEPSIHPF
uniref:Uncharacterized protein n=1 Tax=Sus scrofa TaxID=9823 RepID=A0A8D1T1G3_PIG